MNKYLMVILLAILSMGIVFGISCGQTTPVPTPPDETPTVDETLSVADAVAKVSPSVVYIVADYGRWHSSATGILIDAKGCVLTNNHVVEEGYYAMIRLSDNRQIKAEIVYRDPSRDLAILECPGSNYSAIALGSTKHPSLGEDVIAIGFPSAVLGDSVSISKGIISAFRTIGGVRYIQTDASIGPGSSGGPLINTRGEVIGINTWKLTESEGINFAIEIGSVKAYIENTVRQLANGELRPLKAPPPQNEAPAEGVVLQYHGTGSTRTPTFNINAGSSPWKLFFEPEWDGRPLVWVNEVSKIGWLFLPCSRSTPRSSTTTQANSSS